MENNICFFVPKNNDQTLNIINFVLETKPQLLENPRTDPYYKAILIRSGTGILYTANQKFHLKSGVLFFTFPGKEYAIETGDELTYIYVSFLGPKGNMLLERAKINHNNFYFANYENLLDIWENAIFFSDNARTSASEGLLLYTFAFLENKTNSEDDKNSRNPIIDKIIKLAEQNITNSNFGLETICSELKYNKKYISTVFKKQLGVGVPKYMNTIRVQRACYAIEQGLTSICDIAYMCGFEDPQYFSKVFKKQIGLTPTEYIKKHTPQERINNN